jgi:hypothetical protein
LLPQGSYQNLNIEADKTGYPAEISNALIFRRAMEVLVGKIGAFDAGLNYCFDRRTDDREMPRQF